MKTTRTNYRVFKFDGYDGDEPSYRFIDEKEIQKDFNVYGFYRKNEDYKELLDNYREERNDYMMKCVEENPECTLKDIKELLEYFISDYEYSPDGFSSLYGRPTLFFNPEEEELTSSLDGWYWEDGSPVNEDDMPNDNHYEFIEEWDGSNYRKTYLSGEGIDFFVEEITDLDEVDVYEFEKLGSNKEFNSTRWEDYYWDNVNNVLWVKCITLWQGEVNTWKKTEEYEAEDILISLEENGYNVSDYISKIQA